MRIKVADIAADVLAAAAGRGRVLPVGAIGHG
jgi:hypothetical protein